MTTNTPAPGASRARVAAPAPPRRRIPALDGLRAIAVIGVLLFHGGVLSGGFLGVSAFFTLSGFLITGLLLGEWASAPPGAQRGVIRLRRFWARRARRLLPAAYATIGLVLVYGAAAATAEQLGSLRGDVLAALGYVANWRFLAVGRDYSRLFADPSPVQHFWSLAIEEQFYLVFPLLVAAVARLSRRPSRRDDLGDDPGDDPGDEGADRFHRTLTVVLAVLAAISVAVGMRVSPIHAYYGTDTRAAELLVGAVLACILARSGATAAGAAGGAPAWPPPLSERVQRAARAVGPPVALALVTSWWIASRDSQLLARGGFALHAVGVAVVIVAVLAGGPLPAVLASRPLVAIGRISYGIYLYHWPIFLFLTPERTGLGRWPLLAVRGASSVSVAAISWILVERPVLEGGVLPAPRARIALPASLAVLGANLALVTVNPPVGAVPLDVGRGEISIPAPVLAASPVTESPAEPQPTALATTTTAAPGSLRVMVVGDSIALTLAAGLVEWGKAHPELRLFSAAESGCSLGTGGTMRALGYDAPDPAKCAQRNSQLAHDVDTFAPTVVVVMSCLWDVADRMLPGDDTWRVPLDPIYTQWSSANLEQVADALGGGGATVAWATCPRLDPVYHPEVYMGPPPYPVAEPGRVTWLNDQIRAVATTRPYIHVIDIAAHAAAWSGGELDPERRPDGVHFSREAAFEVTTWMLDQLGITS